MSKFYNETIQTALADKLYKVGMPKEYLPPQRKHIGNGIYVTEAVECWRMPKYSDALDWLMQNGLCVSISAINVDDKVQFIGYLMDLNSVPRYDGSFGYKSTWEEAITPAIEKAIELLKEK